jgi:hypothetical protein
MSRERGCFFSATHTLCAIIASVNLLLMLQLLDITAPITGTGVRVCVYVILVLALSVAHHVESMMHAPSSAEGGEQAGAETLRFRECVLSLTLLALGGEQLLIFSSMLVIHVMRHSWLCKNQHDSTLPLTCGVLALYMVAQGVRWNSEGEVACGAPMGGAALLFARGGKGAGNVLLYPALVLFSGCVAVHSRAQGAGAL